MVEQEVQNVIINQLTWYRFRICKKFFGDLYWKLKRSTCELKIVKNCSLLVLLIVKNVKMSIMCQDWLDFTQALETDLHGNLHLHGLIYTGPICRVTKQRYYVSKSQVSWDVWVIITFRRYYHMHMHYARSAKNTRNLWCDIF